MKPIGQKNVVEEKKDVKDLKSFHGLILKKIDPKKPTIPKNNRNGKETKRNGKE